MDLPAPCKFPFKYMGKVYHQCTTQDYYKPWCALDMSDPNSQHGHDCELCSKKETFKWGNCKYGKPCGLGNY